MRGESEVTKPLSNIATVSLELITRAFCCGPTPNAASLLAVAP